MQNAPSGLRIQSFYTPPDAGETGRRIIDVNSGSMREGVI